MKIPELRALVSRAWDPDPQERPHAAEMLQELEGIAERRKSGFWLFQRSSSLRGEFLKKDFKKLKK